jgi:hypothetical protein
MTGFGTYPFGSTPFGRDPSVPSGPRGAYLPAALEYDGQRLDWAVDADGRHKSLHPIDSGVQLAMFVQRGELKSSPSTGNTLLSSTELGTSRQQQEAESIVRTAQPLKRYLEDGSVTILRIETEVRTSTGALLVALYYRNNVTSRDQIARSTG